MEEGEEPTPDDFDLTKWGWLHVYMSVSGRDFTKFEQISTIPAEEVFTYMSYLMDHNQYEQYRANQLQRRYR